MGTEWPFVPDHISNNSHDYGLKGKGIISSYELSGIETQISARLKNPSTIYEFYGLNGLKRTDSILEEDALVKSCRLFRSKTNRKLCLKQDEMVAAVFKNLTYKDVKKEIKKRISQLPSPTFPVPDKFVPVTLSMIGMRPYVFYDCIYLGYRELMFPIFNIRKIGKDDKVVRTERDKVIGVFVIGEICINEHLETVKEIQRNFFNYIDQSSKKGESDSINLPYCSIFSKECTNILSDRDNIKSFDKNLWDKKSEFCKVKSESEYHNFIKKINIELNTFERDLAKKLENERESYSLKKTDEILSDLYFDLPDINISILEERPLRQLWENIEKRLQMLVESFSFKYIALFAKDNPLTKDESELPLVAYSNSPRNPEKYKKPIEQCDYDTKHIPHDTGKNSYSSNVNPEILHGLSDRWPERTEHETTTVLTYPMPFHPKTPIIIVCGHNIQAGPSHISFLLNTLKTFAIAVASVLSGVLERLTEQKTTNSIRVLRHETEPQTQGLKSLVHSYIGSPGALKRLDISKAKDICNDVDDYLDHINYLFQNARHLLTILLEKEEFRLQKSKFFAYGDIYYKFKDFFRYYLNDRGMEMPLPKAAFDELHPEVYADKRLTELMLFNIITNAYKYGHHGTKIHLKYILREKYYAFTVTNFGNPIEDTNKIFRLFVRTPYTYGEEGAGIGLPMARAIAIAHGGQVSCNCKHICDFNVPFIEPFLKFVKEGKLDVSKSIVQRVKDASIKLKKKDLDRIISSKFDPFPNECFDHINLPTYEISFEANLSIYNQIEKGG